MNQDEAPFWCFIPVSNKEVYIMFIKLADNIKLSGIGKIGTKFNELLIISIAGLKTTKENLTGVSTQFST